MKFKHLLLGIAATSATVMVSCSSTEGYDTITEESFLNCYAVVTDITQPGNETVCTPVTIKWTANWTQLKGEALITGLNVGANYSSLTIMDVPWQMPAWGEAKAAAPSATFATGAPASVTDFSMSWLDRNDFCVAIGTWDPGLVFSLVLDGRYKVVGSRSPIALAGTITSTPENGNAFTTKKALCSFVLDFATRTCELRLVNIQFSQLMPQMSQMAFPGIPFTIADDGKTLNLNCESLIPTIGNTPYPSFPITRLTAKVVPGQGADFSFVCTVKDEPYTVTGSVDYTSYDEAIAN